jgi:uncharacterized membrane protein
MAAEYKYADYLKGGWETVVKPNLVPCVIATLCMCIPILGIQVAINFLKAIKENKNGGKPIEVGALFDMANIVNNIIACFIMGLSAYCFLVPYFILMFIPPILADHPGISFMDAVKAALAYGKQNIVPNIILGVVFMCVIIAGEIACGVGVLIAIPVVMSGMWLAYEEHKAQIHAAAAEAGITLA